MRGGQAVRGNCRPRIPNFCKEPPSKGPLYDSGWPWIGGCDCNKPCFLLLRLLVTMTPMMISAREPAAFRRCHCLPFSLAAEGRDVALSDDQWLMKDVKTIDGSSRRPFESTCLPEAPRVRPPPSSSRPTSRRFSERAVGTVELQGVSVRLCAGGPRRERPHREAKIPAYHGIPILQDIRGSKGSGRCGRSTGRYYY